MEPNTASRLRERPNARLRDYLTIAPSLKVTHLLAFTLTDAANVHLRVARFPQGPTMTFRVQKYSLMKDLFNSGLRNIGRSPAGEYRNPPLVCLQLLSKSLLHANACLCLARIERLPTTTRWARASSTSTDEHHVPRSLPSYPS